MNNNATIPIMSKSKIAKLKIYSLISLLNSYSQGIILPVLSLMLLDKGLNLSNLSIVMGTYALTVVLLELPTGIAADILGRKKIFCLSLIISAISFTLILAGSGILAMIIAMVFYGLNKALASGSFDALFIDWYIESFGKEKLSKITTRLSVLEALGLSIGALTGGLFPVICKNYLTNLGIYDLNLIVKIILIAVLLALSVIFIKETDSSEKKERISFKVHISNCSSTVSKNNTLLFIFISLFSTGIFFSSLETYWQPYFKSLLPDNGMIWLLGIMAFLYFAAAMAGSIISEKVIEKFKPDIKKMYLTTRLFLAISLILMSLQIKIPFFISFYAITYLIFGLANIPEGVIINGEIPNEIRASVLSIYSLILQIGALSGSFINSILINHIAIPVLWIIASCIILLTCLIAFIKFRR